MPMVVKKHLHDLIRDKYFAHEAAIDRVAIHAMAQRDAEELMKLFNAVYEAGFESAVDGYKDQLKKMGYKVNIRYANDGV